MLEVEEISNPRRIDYLLFRNHATSPSKIINEACLRYVPVFAAFRKSLTLLRNLFLLAVSLVSLHGFISKNTPSFSRTYPGLVTTMCKYLDRVHKCGHYKRSVWDPCDAAKKVKSLCDPPEEKRKKIAEGTSNTSVKTETWCGLDGCSKRPAVKRDGPGNARFFSLQFTVQGIE
jgi:hypothetical protein